MSSPRSPFHLRPTPIEAAIEDAAAAWVARRDAGLDSGEERDYACWLNQNPAHRAAIDRLDSAWGALDQPLRTGTADLVLGELQARASRRHRRRLATGAAACLVAIGLAAFGVQRVMRGDGSSGRPIVAAIVLPSIRSLPDGSVAELRDGADIAVDFSGRQRRIILRRGEAHFQVVKNTERPFIVSAGSLEVRAVGTSFSVQLGGSAVEVLVTSGRVAVDSLLAAVDLTGAAQTVATIDAGGGVVVGSSAQSAIPPSVVALDAAQVQQRLAWRSPRLEFSGTTLLEAVALLNRHNSTQFVIEDHELAQTRISGIFAATNTAAFVRALEVTFKVKAEPRGENEIVLRLAR